MEFTAIDFENATAQRHTICQIGLVVFDTEKPGKVIGKLDILVQPPNNEYGWRQSLIHGIKAGHTINKPTFAEIWPKIKLYIENRLLIAHNGNSFDFVALRKTLIHYGLEVPDFQTADTYRLYKKGLKPLCEEHEIPLNHHDACSDAYACGILYCKWLEEQKRIEEEKLKALVEGNPFSALSASRKITIESNFPQDLLQVDGITPKEIFFNADGITSNEQELTEEEQEYIDRQ